MIRAPTKHLAFLCATALLLGACRGTVDFRHPTPAMVADSDPLPVTISSDLRGLRARSSEAGVEITFKVGNLLRPLFPGTDGRAFLNLLDSDMQVRRSDAAWSAEYLLTVTLQFEGASQVISGHGTASSPESLGSAGRSAIESCVGDVYAQVAAHLRTSRR